VEEGSTIQKFAWGLAKATEIQPEPIYLKLLRPINAYPSEVKSTGYANQSVTTKIINTLTTWSRFLL
jgi:hypothetical protein